MTLLNSLISNERDALVVLNAMPGLGPKRISQLKETFGSALKALEVDRKEWAQAGFSLQGEELQAFVVEEFFQKENALLAKYNAEVITIDDASYPTLLKEIPDAPVVLYVKGDKSILNNVFVAMVGSRKCSFYGQSVASRLAGELVAQGLSVASGMARGIDTSVHQGALNANGVTVAVLGCGLSHVYPSENRELMQKILEKGAVISEYPMDMQPLPFNFPRRNRIISGLSKGVVVVEAGKGSGALITSDCALEQGREVFAVPGSIDSAYSMGTNELIKQGAKLVASCEDILTELKMTDVFSIRHPACPDKCKQARDERSEERSPRSFANAQDDPSGPRGQIFESLTDTEREVVNVLSKEKPFHIDKIAEEMNVSVSALYAILFGLEVKGVVAQLPGSCFIKKI